MSNYETYQLQWMIDHGYSLLDMFTEMNKVYQNRTYFDNNSPLSIFLDWENDVGFNGDLWVCEETYNKHEMGKEEVPVSEPKYYSYRFRFYADLPLTNKQFTEEELMKIARKKLTSLPHKFECAKPRRLKYNFKSCIHFEAEIEAITYVVFCVKPGKSFYQAFMEAIHSFEKSDCGIGLTNVDALIEYISEEDGFTEGELAQMEITKEEFEKDRI